MKTLLTLVITALALQGLFAQNLNVSPYSTYGLGLLEKPGTFANRLLSGNGVVAKPFNGQAYANAAHLADVEVTSFDLGLHSSFQNIEESGVSGSNQNTRFSYAYLAFPIKRNSIGFMAGLEPYSSVGYISSGDITSTAGTSTNTFWSEGGVNKLNLSLAKKWEIDSSLNVSLGASYLYYFGNIEKTRKSTFAIAGALPYTSTQNLKVNGSGLAFGLSAQKQGEKNTLDVGLTLRPGHGLSLSNTFVGTSFSDNNIINTIDTIEFVNNEKSDSSIPSELSMGVAYTFNKRVQLSLAYTSSDWSNFNLVGEKNFSSASTLGLGLQIKLKNRAQRSPSLFLSAATTDSYIQISNKPLVKQNIAAGVSLPIAARSKSKTSLLFGIEVADFNSEIPAYNETHFNVLFGVSLTPGVYDKWFRKPKYD